MNDRLVQEHRPRASTNGPDPPAAAFVGRPGPSPTRPDEARTEPEQLGLLGWLRVLALPAHEIEYRAQGAPALEGAWTTGRGAVGARNFGDVRRASADREGPP